MTVSEFRDGLEELSVLINSRGVKEFYIIKDFENIGKFLIPEEYQGEFEPFHSGGDYGGWTANTAEFIYQFASDMEANMILMDFEIDEFLETLTAVRNSEAEKIY